MLQNCSTRELDRFTRKGGWGKAAEVGRLVRQASWQGVAGGSRARSKAEPAAPALSHAPYIARCGVTC